MTYMQNSGTFTFNHESANDFDATCSDKSFTYSVEYLISNNVQNYLPNFLTYVNKVFTVDSDIATIATYTIWLTGVLNEI